MKRERDLVLPACLAVMALSVGIGAVTTRTAAQDNPLKFGPTTSSEIARIPACEDGFPQLPKVAERLGVSTWDGNMRGAAFVLAMCDGRKYSFVELVNALLDRMDKAATR